MNYSTRLLDDPGLRLNRRHFFSRTSLGLGGAALASLLSEPGSRRADGAETGATPTQQKSAALADRSGRGRGAHGVPRCAPGQASHLSVHERRAVAARPVRLQAAPEQDERPGPARVGPDGPAAYGDVGQPGDLAAWPARSSSSPGTASRGPGSASCLPHTAGVVDELCIIKSLYTEAINHDPAITFFQTGSTIAGRPSMGSWLSYGLGSANQNLPTFCVLISQKRPDQPLYSRLWGNGFLPSVHQGVEFRAGADPVLYLENPPGVSARRPPQDARPAPRAAPDRVRRGARPGDPGPDRPVRDGLPDADLGARGDAARR